MVLVDTSVWIRFLCNRQPFAGHLERLLSFDEVSGHNLVSGELLIGDCGGRQGLLHWYESIHHAPVVPHQEVADFVRNRKVHGRGIGWVDAHLLASALVGKMPLWTADQNLAAIAAELGVGYPQPA